jgi:hypothetical protein
VWVDEGGGCQYGHESDCVERLHEQPDPSSPDRPFGTGPLPSELNRFSWGAFLLPLFWGVAYGVWPLVAIWAGVLVTPLMLSAFAVTPGQTPPASTVVGVSVISELVRGLGLLWAGTAAYRMLWRRESFRLEVLTGSRPRFTVERFLSRQRVWTVWGAVIMIVGTAVMVPFGFEAWRSYGLAYAGALMPLLWLAAELLLAFWLDVRMRAEPPDGERTAGAV